MHPSCLSPKPNILSTLGLPRQHLTALFTFDEEVISYLFFTQRFSYECMVALQHTKERGRLAHNGGH